jgi:hypothetical protein
MIMHDVKMTRKKKKQNSNKGDFSGSLQSVALPPAGEFAWHGIGTPRTS